MTGQSVLHNIKGGLQALGKENTTMVNLPQYNCKKNKIKAKFRSVPETV